MVAALRSAPVVLELLGLLSTHENGPEKLGALAA